MADFRIRKQQYMPFCLLQNYQLCHFGIFYNKKLNGTEIDKTEDKKDEEKKYY